MIRESDVGRSAFEPVHHSRLTYSEAYEPKPYGRFDADFNRGKPPGWLVWAWHGRRLTDPELFDRMKSEAVDADEKQARQRARRSPFTVNRDAMAEHHVAVSFPLRLAVDVGEPMHYPEAALERVFGKEKPRISSLPGSAYDKAAVLLKRPEWWPEDLQVTSRSGALAPRAPKRLKNDSDQVVMVIVPGRGQEVDDRSDEKMKEVYARAWGHKPREETGKDLPFDWRDPQPAAGKPISRVTIQRLPLPELRDRIWKVLEPWKLTWWLLPHPGVIWVIQESLAPRPRWVSRVKPDGLRPAPAVEGGIYDVFQSDAEQFEAWMFRDHVGDVMVSLFSSGVFRESPAEVVFFSNAWLPKPGGPGIANDMASRYPWQSATWSWATKRFPFRWSVQWIGKWVVAIWESWSKSWSPPLPAKAFKRGRKPIANSVKSSLNRIDRIFREDLPPEWAARKLALLELTRQLNYAFEAEDALVFRATSATYREAVRRLSETRGISEAEAKRRIDAAAKYEDVEAAMTPLEEALEEAERVLSEPRPADTGRESPRAEEESKRLLERQVQKLDELIRRGDQKEVDLNLAQEIGRYLALQEMNLKK
jgi:hypothetical protein